jgi:hypothetical protein
MIDLGIFDHFVIVDVSAFLLCSGTTDELHVAWGGEAPEEVSILSNIGMEATWKGMGTTI